MGLGTRAEGRAPFGVDSVEMASRGVRQRHAKLAPCTVLQGHYTVLLAPYTVVLGALIAGCGVLRPAHGMTLDQVSYWMNYNESKYSLLYSDGVP